ncbi:hypothetical protein GCM10009840_28600 [Pseudolysinimonas kribbensis]|uniref:DUF805 domain-containing protein n=1 Tax=Pseudolysinimonas kribbensis TaxID=433641 RepID=A0ABQ6K6N2_9MICO|nr:DUF805 domain-containing protein [Pseudolysinimonas kribbensis]GMA96311.1 hypothetical protein GCM10025881_31350 [Pseudolysinimonas kribbensis]
MTTADSGRLDQPLYGAGFVQSVQRFYRNYATFSGRASRSEYWWTVLFFAIVYAVLYVLTLVLGLSLGSADQTAAVVIISVFGGIAGVVFLGSIVPTIAIQWRRLHDANLSGGFWFLHLIPWVGALIVLILTILPSNPYGVRFDAGAGGYAPYPPSAPLTPPTSEDRRI